MIMQPPNVRAQTANMSAGLDWNNGLAAKLNAAFHKAQMAVDSDALMYTLKYTRQRTGALRDSAILHTTIGSGEITQETPYAKEVYYGGGRVSRAVNPFACRRWFETVSANHREEILNHAKAVMVREMR